MFSFKNLKTNSIINNFCNNSNINISTNLSANTNLNNLDKNRDYNSHQNPFANAQVSPPGDRRVEKELMSVVEAISQKNELRRNPYNSDKNPFTNKVRLSPAGDKKELLPVGSSYENSPDGDLKYNLDTSRENHLNQIGHLKAAISDASTNKEALLDKIRYLEKKAIPSVEASLKDRVARVQKHIGSFSFHELTNLTEFNKRDEAMLGRYQEELLVMHKQLMQLGKELPSLEKELNMLTHSLEPKNYSWV